MGKVGSLQVVHKGSGKYAFIEIHFSTSTKKFTTKLLPEEVTDYYKSKYGKIVMGDSYAECEANARQAFNEYYSQQIKEEKIIAYRLQYNSPTIGKYQFFKAPSNTLGVEYKVLWRITVGNESFISTGNYAWAKEDEDGRRLGARRMNPENTSLDPYDKHIKVPHTDKLEAFLENLVSKLDSLTLKVVEFFGEDQQTLLDNLNQNKLLN